MALPVERPRGTVFLHRPRIDGAIEFRNVTFSYPARRRAALDGVSFSIAPGERVGILGRIGSGKTTIETLILGLYRADRAAPCWSTAPTCARSTRPTCAATSAACRRTCTCSTARCKRQHHAGRAVRRRAVVLRAAQHRRRRRFRRAASAGLRPAGRRARPHALGRPAPGGRASPARCCSTRRSWCSTSRPARWTTAPRAAFKQRLGGSRRARRWCWSPTASRCCRWSTG